MEAAFAGDTESGIRVKPAMKRPHHYTLDQSDLGGVLVRQGIEPRGVCHVGAHEGQEAEYYRKLGFDPIVLVEADPALAFNLRQRFGSSVEIVAAAAGAEAGSAMLNVTVDTQMSSLLKPLNRGPFKKVEVPVVPLSSVIDDRINVLVVDVQGAELDVLDGTPVEGLDLIVLEVGTNLKWYEGMPHADVVNDYMDDMGWKSVYEFAHGPRAVYFDVAYVRKT